MSLKRTHDDDLFFQDSIGQRWHGDIGLHYYNARWYDQHIGRFIQPDTIVPEPGNAQSLNRYAYVLNNPLRYTDPTGMFSEDEIMKYFGVGTWDEVLAMFGEDGILSGAWGFLEVLQQAELGDEISMWYDLSDGIDAYSPQLSGAFVEQDGQLVFTGVIGKAHIVINLPATVFGMMSRNSRETLYQVAGKGFYWNQKYYHYRREKNIDWPGVGLDATGILADILTFGAGGRVINGIQVAKVAKQVSSALDIASVLYASTKFGVTAWKEDKEAVGDGAMDVTLAGAGIYVPIIPDIVSLYRGFVDVSP